MAAEMPAKVDAVAGATVVDFPWSAATAAVTALNQAASTLGSQLEARATMLPTIVDWVGSFRDEFDGAYSRITGTGSGLRETLQTLASSIVSGAEDANQQQRTYNTAAQQQDTAATTPSGSGGGRNIPI